MAERQVGPIHLTDEGQGPAVLFLHAFPVNGAMWAGQLAALRDGYRCLVPDLPGFGRTPPSSEPAPMESFARALVSVLDGLEIPSAALVGLSMGGYVAFALQALAPDRVAALALCDTRAHGDSEDGKRARETTARAVESEGVQVLAERMLPTLLSPAADAALRGEVERMILATPPAGAAAALRAMARRQDFAPRLPALTCPTLVLAGAADTLTPPGEMEGMARSVPHATFETVPGAGHLSNMENPSAFNGALRSFLEESILV